MDDNASESTYNQSKYDDNEPYEDLFNDNISYFDYQASASTQDLLPFMVDEESGKMNDDDEYINTCDQN